MKRYDLFSECPCGVGFEPLCEESTDGSWVDADIAQELYDVLKESRDVIQGLIYEGYMGYMPLRSKIDNVLEKSEDED